MSRAASDSDEQGAAAAHSAKERAASDFAELVSIRKYLVKKYNLVDKTNCCIIYLPLNYTFYARFFK
jgi:hypothetical protein